MRGPAAVLVLPVVPNPHPNATPAAVSLKCAPPCPATLVPAGLPSHRTFRSSKFSSSRNPLPLPLSPAPTPPLPSLSLSPPSPFPLPLPVLSPLSPP
eukprot:scaffold105107_cov25-Tisochrysis_lutea.AAC.1